MVILFAMSNIAFGADASSTTASDIVKGEYLLNSGQYKCRDVASDYRTEIDGYDLLTGTVYCKIYPNSKKVKSDKALAGDAGTRNIAQSYKHWLENDKKASILKKIENIQNQGLKYADALGGYEVTNIEKKTALKCPIILRD